MTDIDTLMTRLRETNAKTPAELNPTDISTLIALYRNQRARRAAGEKVKTAVAERPKPTLSLRELMALAPGKPSAELPPPTKPLRRI